MADKKGEVNQGDKSVLGMPVSFSSFVLAAELVGFCSCHPG